MKIFKYFSKYCLGFSNVCISVKFLPSFLKTMAKFLRASKFYQKLRNTNFCILTFLHSFLKISSPLMIIQSCTIMSAKPLQEKYKFSRNFIKISRQPYTDFKICLKMLAKLLPGAYRKNYSGGGRGQDCWKCQVKVWVINYKLFFYVFLTSAAQSTLSGLFMGLIRHCLTLF